MNDKVSKFLIDFEESINRNEKFLPYTRGIEFQRNSVIELETLMKRLVQLKEDMIQIQDEDSANIMLGLEQYLNVYIHELKMLVLLKEDKMDDAWQALITAQCSLRSSLQASDVALRFDAKDHLQRLFVIEKLFFPPQTFVSVGLTAYSSICSICDQEYGQCNHVVGKPYMGNLCYRIVTDVKAAREVSFVDEPGSKFCRVTQFSDNNEWRNWMTWRTEKKESSV